MSYDRAIKFTLGQEVGGAPNGGYVNDPRDPGGETKYGICKKSHPDLNIRGLTLDQAKEIYRQDYYDAKGLDKTPDGIDQIMFDMAVNGGFGSIMQASDDKIAACGLGDGKLDPKYTNMIVALILLMERVKRYTKLAEANPKLKAFIGGWIRRVVALYDDVMPTLINAQEA